MIVALLPAASNSGFSVFPWFFVIFVVLAVLGQIANARKRARAKQQNGQQYQQAPPVVNNFGTNYQAPPANFQSPAAPPNGYAQPAQFQQPPANGSGGWAQAAPANPEMSGFASSRWAAEQDLKRLLTELDQRRRAGQLTAEQYEAEREAIFRNR